MDKQKKLIELLQEKGVQLTDEELKALDQCFGKRGKYSGYLKKTAPSATQYPLANVIYNVITPNPYKMQIFNLMMIGDKYRSTYEKLSKFTYPTWLDLDKEQLTDMGVW